MRHGARWWWSALLAALLTLAGRSARAQEVIAWPPRSGYGGAFLIGGGVNNFSGSRANDATRPGGGWNVRAVVGTRTPVGFELAYSGGMHDIRMGGTGNDDTLVHNGFEGGLRLALPLTPRRALIAPFLYAGVGWDRYDVIERGQPPPGWTDDDYELAIPVGLGLAAALKGVMVELRAGYRKAFDEEVFGQADMSTWSVMLSLGGEL
jgi:hypothetical protein